MSRVGEETGEQFFSPTSVEQVQRVILHSQSATMTIETPLYEYAEELPPTSPNIVEARHGTDADTGTGAIKPL
jgi:hypothetical protein